MLTLMLTTTSTAVLALPPSWGMHTLTLTSCQLRLLVLTRGGGSVLQQWANHDHYYASLDVPPAAAVVVPLPAT